MVMILIFSLCNWSIDIARSTDSITPILGLIYLLIVFLFVFLDALKVKSRVFVVVVGVIFVFVNVYSIYTRIFGDADQGIVLLKYTIQGNDYTFMKRSVKRSILIQVMLFSITGIYTLRQETRIDDLRHRTYLSRDGNRVEGSER